MRKVRRLLKNSQLMKNIVFLIIVSLMAAYVAFGQCCYPRLGMGVGLHAIDSAAITPTVTRCTPCPTDGTVSWSLDSAFNGHVFFNSTDSGLVTIQITKGCDMLFFDTCVVLPPPGIAGWAYVKEFAVYADAQIHVSGRAGQMVYVDVKGMPTPTEQLDIILLDLNTCNTPVGIQDPIEQQYTNWLNIFDHTRYKCEKRDLPTAGIYWNYNDAGQGRKVIVTK